MEVTTTKRYAAARPKEWSWSYSKLKNYEDCPRRHQHLDILKDIEEEPSEHILWGNQVHAAAVQRLERGVPVPKGMEFLTPWCDRIDRTARGGKLLTEQKYAMTRQMQPCSWFDDQTWVRAIADVLVLRPPKALATDWKTGRIIEDSVQLALVGALVFAHHPEITAVRAQFVWLKEGADSTVDMHRTDLPSIWQGLMPRVDSLEQAALTNTYPPKPGRYCARWCPVASCEYHGKRFS